MLLAIVGRKFSKLNKNQNCPEMWRTVKTLFKYINGKRQHSNIIDLLQDADDHLPNRDRGKAEVFNMFFASIFNTNDGPRGSQYP